MNKHKKKSDMNKKIKGTGWAEKLEQELRCYLSCFNVLLKKGTVNGIVSENK